LIQGRSIKARDRSSKVNRSSSGYLKLLPDVSVQNPTPPQKGCALAILCDLRFCSTTVLRLFTAQEARLIRTYCRDQVSLDYF